jgi:hypothetical protein
MRPIFRTRRGCAGQSAQDDSRQLRTKPIHASVVVTFSPHAANRKTAPQISAHSPSDSSSTKVIVSPRLSWSVGLPRESEESERPCQTLQVAAEESDCDDLLLSICSPTLPEKHRPSAPHSWGVSSRVMLLGGVIGARRAEFLRPEKNKGRRERRPFGHSWVTNSGMGPRRQLEM